MNARTAVPLLTHDPELGRLLPAERMDAARDELLVRLHALRTGEWHADRLASTDPGHVGLLVLEGMLAREVVVGDTVSAELIGPGDLVRPWGLEDENRLLRSEVRWMVLAPCRMAVLDARFAAALVRYPEVNAVLIDRLSKRAQRLATTQAISQLNRVDRRLMALLWHLAERWGRMGTGGVVVPLGLSHRMLAQLIGARRPTVSTALAELARQGEIVRREDGTWLLAGEPAGVPSGEAARVIRGRRQLLPAAPAAPSHEGAELEPTDAVVTAVARPEASRTAMRDAVERLRKVHAQGSVELMALTDRAEQLQAQTVRLRAQMRNRHRRFARGP